jgi:eukaryotic-like serine/threonine-protein kinase
MTPERWRQIDDLFDAALQIRPADRDAWLRSACGDDEDLHNSVGRLLALDQRADREEFLTPPDVSLPYGDLSAIRSRTEDFRPWHVPPAIEPDDAGSLDATSAFSPKAAIAADTGQSPLSETPSVVRARLRELPVIYILIVVMAAFWRRGVLGSEDMTLYRVDAVILAVLVSFIAFLWSRWPVPLAWLKGLEVGMLGLLAARFAFVEYRLILEFSLGGDVMMAQLTLKNIVLVTAILILTNALYVPKSWRRAALVVGPLALLPFATLMVLHRQHPEAMGWLWEGWKLSRTPRIRLYTFDALILIILAVGSTFGARAMSLLRRQVVEARQLGQYRLRQRIGTGGMGEVYLAEHQLLKRPCALKLIRPGHVDAARALKRFEREVRITATLSHPNTVEIFDYGRTDDGIYYYVMEYLPGLSLAELVERHGPLPPARAVYLLRQVCEALHEAHSAGLIHRDIKPSNIFAARRGGRDDVAKLLDFGLVRPAPTPVAAHLSEEGQILGTPMFMSPEQATGGRQLDQRSDIYSLGAVAYYLLTGRPPFDAASGIGVLIAHARDPAVPPSQVRAGIPLDLDQVVLRCLAKNPADRFPDAESLERALGACSCVADWDQGRSARWWQEIGQPTTTPASVG